MPNTCPDCGTQVEFSASTARVLHGDCTGCGHAFTIFEGAPPLPAGQAAAEPGEETPEVEGPECESCGGPLTFRATSDTTLEATCAACNSQLRYTLATAPTEEEPPRRPRRFDSPREDRDRSDRPPSRPCRECGGALRFTTTPEGLVTGECTQCGNRFTLPPRREGGGRDSRPPFRRSGGGGYRPRYGGGGGYSRGGGRSGPPRAGGGGRSYRPRDSRRDDDDDDSDRRRRRPRRE